MSPKKLARAVGQNALKQSYQSQRPEQNFPYAVEAVVVGIHYPDDPVAVGASGGSRSRTAIEYDVEVTSVFNMGRLLNVPCALGVSAGIDDGDETILRVADSAVTSGGGVYVASSAPNSKQAPTPKYDTTGDRVVVTFINGNVHRPIITGVLTHTKTRRGVNSAAGDPLPKNAQLFRRSRHRGTETFMDEKGNVTVTFGATPDPQGVDTNNQKFLKIVLGDFEIVIDNTSSPTTADFKVAGGNSIFKFTKDNIDIGPAGVPMALGNKVTAFLNDLMGQLLSHIHIGNLGAPTPLDPSSITAFTALQARAATPDATNEMLSKWAKVSENKP